MGEAKRKAVARNMAKNRTSATYRIGRTVGRRPVVILLVFVAVLAFYVGWVSHSTTERTYSGRVIKVDQAGTEACITPSPLASACSLIFKGDNIHLREGESVQFRTMTISVGPDATQGVYVILSPR